MQTPPTEFNTSGKKYTTTNQALNESYQKDGQFMSTDRASPPVRDIKYQLLFLIINGHRDCVTDTQIAEQVD
ncbi:unnamed protein product [Linum tenue]|uniref:Uncharacterized protein n=1 Tax=Linum tenue TaxID=586396 RepID=A0AAV0ICW8_9ROSI|nr:unnamed protein product [Linum tenue]